MNQRKKSRNKNTCDSNMEPVVENASKPMKVKEEKKKKKKHSSRKRLQAPIDTTDQDQLNLKAGDAAVEQNESDQFDMGGEDTEKPRKAGKLKRGRENKKNCKSLNNCKVLLENREKVRLDAYQTTVDNGDLSDGKAKKSSKKKRKRHISAEAKCVVEANYEVNENDVYQISSGEEDASKGMKKWITEYHENRPGLKVLQQRIDDYIIAHEAQLEQEKKEREAEAAEGGWTVVVHHRGRKKTTDAETGITVGSVAQTAVEDKMSKKKQKEVGLDFYRFQRREAQRNEVLMLQSKFEEDKKRIQQLRAARKFRPY